MRVPSPHPPLEAACKADILGIWHFSSSIRGSFRDVRHLLCFFDQHPNSIYVAKLADGRVNGCLVIGSWRGQGDVIAIWDISCGDRDFPLMLDFALKEAMSRGARLVLAFDLKGERLKAAREVGFSLYEVIVEMVRRRSQTQVLGNTEVEIERVGYGERERLKSIDSRSFPEMWRLSEEALEALFLSQGQNSRVYMALKDGKDIGYVYYSFSGEKGNVGRVGVVPESRRQGVASTLLKYAIDEMQGMGVREVNVHTQRSNLPARSLYSKFGFVEVRSTLEIFSKALAQRAERRSF